MSLPTTLPASWYSSPELMRLERRAVFLRAWFFLGTIQKFEAGSEWRYEIAQVPFVVRTQRPAESGEKIVKTFHETTGEELLSHQTRTGLVFSTISADAPSFDEYFPGLEQLLDRHDFTQRPHRRVLSYPGKYNWKTMMDGFQECLHCQFAHPGLSRLYPPTFYRVVNHPNWSQHFSNPDRDDDGLFLYFFPTTTLNMYNGGMSTFRVCPSSADPGVSRMEYDYYHELTGEKFEDYYRFVREVADEDHQLCEFTQSNLDKGIYSEGYLNPEKEVGVIHYQRQVFDMVAAQHLREKDQLVA
ncbi:hypothetical protein PV08_07390 [Exophiala spinifera]|uniref:Choline monooxygenase, chloroplastic n=1 Tax=Exophiala spinifera TaxID=91928 RepID=A0A0D1YI45_9EURO|nr:uncharacterized protein PV08_07390 [Exophiala spinifera]KIW14606.1 hypothetical protein PV08_07390 [Exophiala spinifera]